MLLTTDTTLLKKYPEFTPYENQPEPGEFDDVQFTQSELVYEAAKQLASTLTMQDVDSSEDIWIIAENAAKHLALSDYTAYLPVILNEEIQNKQLKISEKAKNIKLQIAIDGPAAAGKSTLAKVLSLAMRIPYVNTGEIYRAFTVKALKNPDSSIEKIAENTKIKIEKNIYVDGEDVTGLLRTEAVTNNVNKISAAQCIRNKVSEICKEYADKAVIMEGRDTATNLLPDAQIKIFLTAPETTRAQRRYLELKKAYPDIGFSKVLVDLHIRDAEVEQRSIAPLKYSEEYIYIDNRSLSVYETVKIILEKFYLKYYDRA